MLKIFKYAKLLLIFVIVNPEDLKSFQEINSARVIEMLKNTSERKESLNNNFDYFDIDSNEILEIQEELKTLDLDINKMLAGYSNHIESKLIGLTEKQKLQIKLSIKNKVLNLGGYIKELKSDLEPGEDFKNNRWIVNSKLQESFSEINNKILPSAKILSNFNLGDKNSKRERRPKVGFFSEV